MRALIRGCVSFVLVGVGLATVWAEPAARPRPSRSAPPSSGSGPSPAPTTRPPTRRSRTTTGTSSLTRSDSDTGPDGSASATATISSTASASKVTIAGTASTSRTRRHDVSLYPAVVYLDAGLDQSGQWVFAGSFDTSASDTAYDACIRGSVRVAIYPPGEDDVPDYNELAAVNSCTGGAGHEEFGDLDGAGVALAAGSRLEITGGFTGPSSSGSGTSSASFSLQVSTKAATSVPGKPTVTGSTPSAGAVSVAFSPRPATAAARSPPTRHSASPPTAATTGTTTGAASPIQVTGLSAGKSYRCRVRATNAVGTGAFSAYGATVTVPAATAPGKPTVTGSTPSAGAVERGVQPAGQQRRQPRSPPTSPSASPPTAGPTPPTPDQPARSRSPASARARATAAGSRPPTPSAPAPSAPTAPPSACPLPSCPGSRR